MLANSSGVYVSFRQPERSGSTGSAVFSVGPAHSTEVFSWKGAIMARDTVRSEKPTINVGTIGHIDHGKTTLTAAISARQAHRFGGEAMSYDRIARGGARRDDSKIVTIIAAHVEYETATRHYA